MDQQRKQIILKEIKFWKENWMLPEQYCNNLLSIYSEGEIKDNSGKLGYHKLWALIGVLPFLMISLVTYLLYFTELSLNLQLLIFPIILVIMIISTIILTVKRLIWRHLSYIVIAIISVELIIEWVGSVTTLSTNLRGVI